MLDDLRTYLQMATGVTEATTAKAREVVSGLLASGMALTAKAVPAPDMVGQVQELADDLVETSRNNRELLTGTIRAEVDKAVGRMGFVREDELAAVRRHVQRLQVQVTELEQRMASAPPSPVAESPVAPTPVEESPDAPTPVAESVEAVTADAPVIKKKKKVIVDPEVGA